MSYTVSNGAILEVSIKGTYKTQRFLSLFHYRYERPSGEVDGRVLINTINPLINDAALGKLVKEYTLTLHTDAALEEVVYQWLWPTRRPRVTKTPAVLSGNVAGDPAPPNIAMALTKRGDAAGRHGVGTLHMPALSLVNIDGGEFTLLGQDSYGQMLTKLAEVINIEFGENLIPVILNRGDPANSPQILDTFSHKQVRTMHRRTVGLGE